MKTNRLLLVLALLAAVAAPRALAAQQSTAASLSAFVGTVARLWADGQADRLV